MKKHFIREISYLVILITLAVLLLFSIGYYIRSHKENTIKLKSELTAIQNKIPDVHLLWLKLSDIKLIQFSYEEFIEYYNTPYKQYYLFMQYINNTLGEERWAEFQRKYFFKDYLIFIDLLYDEQYRKQDRYKWSDGVGTRYISDSYPEVDLNGFKDSSGKEFSRADYLKIFKKILRPEYDEGWTRYFRVISLDELKKNYNYEIDWEFILNQLIFDEYYTGDLEQLKFSYNNFEAYHLLEGSVENYENSKSLSKEIKERALFKPWGNEEAFIYVLSSLFFVLFILRYAFYALKNLKK